MNGIPRSLNGRLYSYTANGLISIDIRDICPYPHGTSAYRLLSRKEIQSF
jgi:hypothetical protein